MARIRFTNHLRRFFPGMQTVEEVEGETVAGVVAALDERFPGLKGYLLDDRGALRPHFKLFIGQEIIEDRDTLQDTVGEGDQLYVFQALSSGWRIMRALHLSLVLE